MEKNPHAENARTAKKYLSELGELIVKKIRILTQRTRRTPRKILAVFASFA
jgi:hypothetical protein